MEQVEQKERRSSKVGDLKQIFEQKRKLVPDVMEQIQEESKGYQDISEPESGTENDVAAIDEICQHMEEYEDISDHDEDSVDSIGLMDKISQEMDGYEDISNDQDDSKDIIVKVMKIRHESSEYENISVEGTKQTEEKPCLDGKFMAMKGGDAVPYEFALEILKRYSFKYLDIPSTGKLHRFNGKIWEPLCGQEALEQIVYHEMEDDERREQDNIQSYCKRVVKFIMYECRERYEAGDRFGEEDFREIENRIVFRNCVYDVLTGEMLRHDERLPYYIGIDADYLEDKESTPIYDMLKENATGGDEESMKMFDHMLGYLMLPNRSGKCFFVLAPAKDSGKSVFGHFIESIYAGERVKTVDLERLAGRFSLSNVDGVVLLSGLETGTGRISESVAAQIKRITGEDKIRTESKYRSDANVKIRFKLLLATNGGMILEGGVKDEAFYRRTIVIPFLRSVSPNQIMADMPKFLQQEKSAILSRAARKVGKLIAPDGGIIFPESQKSRGLKALWSGKYSYEKKFIEENLEFTGNPQDAIPKEDVYRRYQECMAVFHGKIAMRTKDELMREIICNFTGVEARKLRRASEEDIDIKLRPCLTGIKWRG